MNKPGALPDDHEVRVLVALLQQHIGHLDASKLSLATSINHDLGCDGDDAAELMTELAERFSIEFVDYDAYRYFNPEGYDLMRWRRTKERRGQTPLTLAMIYQAIKVGRWKTSELEN
jgi:acyl carrier protein